MENMLFRDMTLAESLVEAGEFAKGYNQAGLKMAGNTVIGLVTLPDTIAELSDHVIDQGLANTGKNMVDATISGIKDRYQEDFINGDARSRGEVVGDVVIAAADVALTAIGIGKVFRVGDTASDMAKVGKLADTFDDISDTARTIDKIEDITDGITDVSKVEKVTGQSGRCSNLDDGLNFSNKASEHMSESGRQVPIQTLQDAIRHGERLPDPRGSNATMYYTTMYKNGKMYNLEVLYDAVTNTVYHFEYSRKAMGNLPAISK